MSSGNERRNYNFTDSELYGFAMDLTNNLSRDVENLSVFGINEEKIAQLKDLAVEFGDFYDDVLSSGDVMTIVDEKNRLKAEVIKEIRNMIMRCRLKWGRKSQQEKSLDAAELHNIQNEILLVTSRRVHEIMTGFFPELAGNVLTQEVLDNFESLNTSFETAINDQKIKSSQRISNTIKRKKLGNEIYELVSYYSNIGKNFYSNKNPAKYNNYKIYRDSRKLKKSSKMKEEEVIETPES